MRKKLKANEAPASAQLQADRVNEAAVAPIFVQQTLTEEDTNELDELNSGTCDTPLPPTDKSYGVKFSKNRKASEIDYLEKPHVHDGIADSDSESPVAREVRELNDEPRPRKKFRRSETGSSGTTVAGRDVGSAYLSATKWSATEPEVFQPSNFLVVSNGPEGGPNPILFAERPPGGSVSQSSLRDEFILGDDDGASFGNSFGSSSGLPSFSLAGPGCAQLLDTARFSGFAFFEGGHSTTDEFGEFNGYECEGKSFRQIAIDTNLRYARSWRRTKWFADRGRIADDPPAPSTDEGTRDAENNFVISVSPDSAPNIDRINGFAEHSLQHLGESLVSNSFGPSPKERGEHDSQQTSVPYGLAAHVAPDISRHPHLVMPHPEIQFSAEIKPVEVFVTKEKMARRKTLLRMGHPFRRDFLKQLSRTCFFIPFSRTCFLMPPRR